MRMFPMKHADMISQTGIGEVSDILRSFNDMIDYESANDVYYGR